MAVTVDLYRPSSKTWEPLACDVTGCSTSWGTATDEGVVSRAEAGRAQIEILDPYRRFDPGNADSDLYGDWDLRAHIRIVAETWRVFHGWIDDVMWSDGKATVSAYDKIGALSAIEFSSTSRPLERADARINAILTAAGVTGGGRNVEAAGQQIQSGAYQGSAWSALSAVTRSEIGALWIDRLGVIQWLGRTSTWASAPPVLTIGCAPSDGLPRSFELETTPYAQWNRITGARGVAVGAAEVVRGPQETADAITRYGLHLHHESGLHLAADSDVDAWIAFALPRQAYPNRGFRTIELVWPDAWLANRTSYIAFLEKLVQARFGAPVRIVDDGHSGPPIDVTTRLLGWRLGVTADPDKPQDYGATITLTLGQEMALKYVSQRRYYDTAADFNGLGQTNVGGMVTTDGRLDVVNPYVPKP